MIEWLCYKPCEDRKWYIFFAIDCAIFVVGYVILYLKVKYDKCFIAKIEKTDTYHTYLNRENNRFIMTVETVYFTTKKLLKLEAIINHLNVFNILLNMILFLIYVYRSSGHPVIESCCIWTDDIFDIVQYSMIFYLAAFFVLEFWSHKKRLEFWTNLFTIINIFTIPNMFIGIYFGRIWSGLLFLRFIWIYKVPDAIQYTGLMDVKNIIRLWHLASIFVSIWITGTGVLFLLENTGDIWLNYENKQNISFGGFFYFTIATMSTVGYGDIVPRTVIGRMFTCIFILISLAIFASFIPEISDIVLSRSIHTSRYKAVIDKKHIVVCGSFQNENMTSFLADFYHENRESKNIEIAFLSRKKPNLYLKMLMKQYTKVEYFEGTSMKIEDLIRIRVDIADACLIVTERQCEDWDAEDAANIMRAISIKNFCPNQRIIIQLQKFQNKVNLLNIPSWCPFIGDEVICFNELKLGILARSCLCNGFSTAICNAFTVLSNNKIIISNSKPWMEEYSRGLRMKLYRETFSPYYYSKSFVESAKHCFDHFRLILIGIEVISEEGESKIKLNPNPSYVISCFCWGYFLCENQNFLYNLSIYCSKCHRNKKIEHRFKICSCYANQVRKVSLKLQIRKSIDFRNREKEKINIKRLHHICYVIPNQSFRDCFLRKETVLTDHIVLFIFSNDNSKVVGLMNFIKPLRLKNDVYNEIRSIVLIGNENYLEREWRNISQFPQVFIVIGSCLDRDVLDYAQVNHANSCVLIQAPVAFNTKTDDPYLVDKEVILGTLNIENYLWQYENETITAEQDFNLIKTNVITDINTNSNMQFLYPADFDSPTRGSYFTQAFASGHAYCNSVLDSLLSSTYYNWNTINLLREFIEGNRDKSLEKVTGIIRLSQIKLISLTEERFLNLSVCQTFGEIYLKSLEENHTVMLGVYRKYESVKIMEDTSIQRIVLLYPHREFILNNSDLFYGLTSNL